MIQTRQTPQVIRVGQIKQTPETLPLFPEASLLGCQPALEPTSIQHTGLQRQKLHKRGVRPRRINPHLAAAKKLSRKIKYLPDHSEAQAETAHAICEHLRLLLCETPDPQ